MGNAVAATLPRQHCSCTATAPVPACISTQPKSTFEIVADEAFATLTGVLPNAVDWVRRLYITKDITPYKLQETVKNTTEVTKTAFLNLHGSLKVNDSPSAKAILFLHGDHSHPYSLLHLADIAQKKRLGPVFSLYLPYDDFKPSIHRALLIQAIDKIQNLMTNNGLSFQGVTAVGHSKGVIEAAYLALVKKEERIKSLIAWAGRLKVTESCEEVLKDSINKIHAALVQNEQFPLFIISAGQEWCCREPESTQVFPHKKMYIAEQASHLNVLFDPEAKKHYETFLDLATATA